jgi:hypothetical protein
MTNWLVALITLEFAIILGVRLGLGLNPKVMSFTMQEISDFPFINDHSMSSVGNDPMRLFEIAHEHSAREVILELSRSPTLSG